MRARYCRGLVFLLACAGPTGCIVGIAEPRGAGTDGGEASTDDAQTAEASDASEVSVTTDAPHDAGGDETMAQGDTGGVDAPAESAVDAPADVTVPDGPPLTHYLVFVTSTTYTGNLGGLAGADQKCMDRAAAAMPSPLPGTFKAWMSDSATSAAAHVTTHGTLPYVLVDGTTVVAADWSALTSANGAQVQNMITMDENGNTVPGTSDTCSGFGGHYVWTNSNDDGTLYTGAGTCQDLTSALNGDTGNTGSASTNQGDTKWWSSWCNGQSCDSLASLYCLQQ